MRLFVYVMPTLIGPISWLLTFFFSTIFFLCILLLLLLLHQYLCSICIILKRERKIWWDAKRGLNIPYADCRCSIHECMNYRPDDNNKTIIFPSIFIIKCTDSHNVVSIFFFVFKMQISFELCISINEPQLSGCCFFNFTWCVLHLMHHIRNDLHFFSYTTHCEQFRLSQSFRLILLGSRSLNFSVLKTIFRLGQVSSSMWFHWVWSIH